MQDPLNCKKPVNVSLRYVEGCIHAGRLEGSWRKIALNEAPTGLSALSVGACRNGCMSGFCVDGVRVSCCSPSEFRRCSPMQAVLRRVLSKGQFGNEAYPHGDK